MRSWVAVRPAQLRPEWATWRDTVSAPTNEPTLELVVTSRSRPLAVLRVLRERPVQTMASQSAFIIEGQLLVEADVDRLPLRLAVHIRSCRPTPNFVERPLPRPVYWRCRPIAVERLLQIDARKRSSNV